MLGFLFDGLPFLGLSPRNKTGRYVLTVPSSGASYVGLAQFNDVDFTSDVPRKNSSTNLGQHFGEAEHMEPSEGTPEMDDGFAVLRRLMAGPPEEFDKEKARQYIAKSDMFEEILGIFEHIRKMMESTDRLAENFWYAAFAREMADLRLRGNATAATAVAEHIKRVRENELAREEFMASMSIEDLTLWFLEMSVKTGMGALEVGDEITRDEGVTTALNERTPLDKDMSIHDSVRWMVQKEIAPEPDGPVRPESFRWDRELYSGLIGLAWNLVYHLWNFPGDGGVPFSELGEPVWGDDEVIVDPDSNLGALRRNANKFFRDNKLPFRVKIKNRRVELKFALPTTPET